MPNVEANGIRIEYEAFGDKNDSTILLIAGNGVQMIGWDDLLCEKLAKANHYVIRYDNRDVGLSTKFEEDGLPNIVEAIQDSRKGKPINASYTYDEMADDAVGLLDAIGISKAHICGASLGAGIAQIVAYRHSDRVLSLISIYGTTGNPELPPPKPEAAAVFVIPPPEGREAIIQHNVNSMKILAGTGFPFDEVWHKDLATHEYDRCYYVAGSARHVLSSIAHGNRKQALSSITAPTLVVHGSEDPIMPLEGGKETAEVIRGAELMVIEGMGHDFPKLGGAWDQITDRIIEFIATADAN
jgi:pimeloyl-ACP methyl ester carboxylesterase